MKKLSLLLIVFACFLVSCKPDLEKPTVVTKSVGEITATTATVVVQVAEDGGAEVTERGVCWNTEGDPTIADFCIKEGTGLGTYSMTLTNLTELTTYYVKAFATNSEGVSYGDVIAFTTLEKKNIDVPTVITKSVGSISQTAAIGGGEVTDDGGSDVIVRGICWGTSPNPTMEGYHTINGTGTGEYSANLTNLTLNTTYYVRAYAVNSVGIGYGQEVSFTTLKEGGNNKPIVTTNEVTEITINSAKCGGEVLSGGDAIIIAKGVCWSTSTNPTVSEMYTIDGDGLGSFTSKLTNLSDSTVYFVRAYATDANGNTSYGEEKSFQTIEMLLPIVNTGDVTNITTTTATCGGEVVADGNATVTARGVCWSMSQNPTIEGNHTSDGIGIGVFTSQLENLVDDTTYYVRAYATNEKGTSYGEEVAIRTLKILLPTVTTNSVTDITTYSAVCGGNVVSDGNAAVTERGVCWSTMPNPTTDDFFTINEDGAGTFVSQMGELIHNTTYYVRAYATNCKGTSYGEEIEFVTLEELLPIVETREISNVKVFSAVCSAVVTFDGNLTETLRGICWSTSPNPTIDDNCTKDGNGAGTYSSAMTKLERNTIYYVRAYATNKVGTVYGKEIAFTTVNGIGTSNGYEWVDLGLPSGIKWASSNVGAGIPEEYGEYYAWGEIATKEKYKSENSLTYGKEMTEISGDILYDAATVNRGNSWRMPTEIEMKELFDNCTWTWTTQNGVTGYKVTGTNDNTIFIPAGGYIRGTDVVSGGIYGYYWTSTSSASKYNASGVKFNNVSHIIFNIGRFDGCNIRPVLD